MLRMSKQGNFRLTMQRRLLLAALTIAAAPAGARASSFATLVAPAHSPSIIHLGAPAPRTMSAVSPSPSAESAAPDPMKTAALSAPVSSPSIIVLGERALKPAAKDPDARDEATAKPKRSSRLASLPIVIRGDFGELRGSTDSAETAVPTTAAESAPEAAAGGGDAPPERPSPQPAKAAKPEPEYTPSPSEMDR